MKFPLLPKHIQGLAGPIRIDRPVVVDAKNPKNIGLWLGDERRILVQSTLSREVAVQVMLHEIGHAALSEAGIHPMSYTREEAVVEAMASGMMHVVRWLLEIKPDT